MDVGAFLDELSATVATVKRKMRPEDVKPAETRAIAQLIVSWGYARIGDRSAAELVRDQAVFVLRGRHAVYDWAADAFAWLIDDALTGASSPLPDSFFQRTLDGMDAYRIDRLRGGSYVLEPAIDPDAIGTFHKQLGHDRTTPRPALTPLSEDERTTLRRWIIRDQAWMFDVEIVRLLRRASVTPGEPLAHYVPLWRLATDRLSTNSHFCLHAIELVDMLVFAACRAQ